MAGTDNNAVNVANLKKLPKENAKLVADYVAAHKPMKASILMKLNNKDGENVFSADITCPPAAELHLDHKNPPKNISKIVKIDEYPKLETAVVEQCSSNYIAAANKNKTHSK